MYIRVDIDIILKYVIHYSIIGYNMCVCVCLYIHTYNGRSTVMIYWNKVHASQQTCWKFRERQGKSTVSKKLPGEQTKNM